MPSLVAAASPGRYAANMATRILLPSSSATVYSLAIKLSCPCIHKNFKFGCSS